MAESLLDQNKNTASTLEKEEVPFSLRCGWRTWRPDCLQSFATPKWFIFVLSLVSITQGLLVNGLMGVSIPDIEKEFGLSSRSAGIILASNDIAGILLVPIVSFWGTHGRKPLWIGLGSIITGIGALLFTLPKLMVGKYKIPGTGKMNPFCVVGGKGNICLERTYDSSPIYLFILCLGQFVMGAGTTPLFTLGPAYLDENVNPKSSPVYIGVWFATTFLGPGVGFALGGMFLRTFTDLQLPPGLNLTPRDPRWVGAWWLGFFVFSWMLVLSGAFLLCFPKEMPKFKVKRAKALQEGNLLQADTDIVKSLRGFVIATIRLLKNKTFIFTVLALTVRTFYGSAIGSFFAKIILLKFGGTTFEISLATGVILLPGMGGGILLGAFIMRKIPLKNSAKHAALICTIVSLLTIGGSTSFLLPGCKMTSMAGATTPYNNSTNIASLNNKCNSDCACSRRIYAPVCGIDGKTYFSPCHAGCQGAISKAEFIQCRCITNASLWRSHSANITDSNLMSTMAARFRSGMAPFPNFSSPFNLTGNTTRVNNFTLKHDAKAGICDRDCKNTKLFLFCSFFLILLVFLSATPQKMILMRCVPENQRSYALGIQFLFLRSLSFIPGPVIFGTVIDSQCVLWSEDNCGNRGNCLDYNIDNLSWNIVLLGLVTGVIGTLFYFLAWFFHNPMPDPVQKVVQYNAEDGVLLGKDETNEVDGNA